MKLLNCAAGCHFPVIKSVITDKISPVNAPCVGIYKFNGDSILNSFFNCLDIVGIVNALCNNSVNLCRNSRIDFVYCLIYAFNIDKIYTDMFFFGLFVNAFAKLLRKSSDVWYITTRKFLLYSFFAPFPVRL